MVIGTRKRKAPAAEMVVVRVPVDVIARVDAMRDVLVGNSEVAILLGRAGEITRSAVVRLAVVEGLRVLERKYALPK